MSAEDFEGIKILAKQNHRSRVAKTPERVKYAISQLEKAGVEYKVCNQVTGQINAKTVRGKTLTFYAGTGKIAGRNERGIANFIRICRLGV